MLGEGVPEVNEDLLQNRYCELRSDQVRAVDDLVERLHDGCAADEDVVAGHGGVPVSPFLLFVSRLKPSSLQKGFNSRPGR